MILQKIKNIIRWVVVLFFSTTILAVVAYRFIPVCFTPLMFIRCFQQVADGESITLHHHWVSMDKISPHMPVAVMASEDARFLKHHGFDFGAIESAAKNNARGGKVHGASTISLPVARSLVDPKGIRGLLHLPHRDDVEQAAHHGGLPQQHRDGTGHLWRGCRGGIPFQ